MTVAIFKLREFIFQKQVEWDKEIKLQDIADGTGMSRATLSKIVNGHTTRIDESTVIALCKFFDVPPGPVPFIVYEPDKADEEEA